MKRGWSTIWRVWPGALTWAVTFGITALLLGPRPIYVALLQLQEPGHISRSRVSADGRHIALLCWGEDDGKERLRLNDAATGRILCCFDEKVHQFEFDNQGGLIAAITLKWGHHPYRNDPFEEQLVRWDLSTGTKTIVCDRRPHRGINQLCRSDKWGSNSTTPSLLSPNGETWLIAQEDATGLWFELIDGRTGQLRKRLFFPEFAKDDNGINVQAGFSDDGRALLVETASSQNSFRAKWLDTMDGREIQTLDFAYSSLKNPLYCPTSTEIIAAPLKSAAESSLLQNLVRAFFNEPDKISVFQARGKAFHRVDITAVLREKSLPGYQREIEKIQVDPSSDRIILMWASYRAGATSVSSFFGYSLFDTTQGTLGLSTCLPIEGGRFNPVDVLPGAVMVLHYNGRPETVVHKWLFMLTDYLSLEVRDASYVYFVDCVTGLINHELNVAGAYWVHNCSLSANNDRLTLITSLITSREESSKPKIDNFCYIYGYPLRKPWLLILSWSFGVALAVTMMVEARRWWKRQAKT